MQETKVYIVDFFDVLGRFKKVIGDPELPTIDADVIKYEVMSIFLQVDPFVHLERIATEMVKEDFLFTKDDFLHEMDESLALTPEEAIENDKLLRKHLRNAIIDLGRAMYQKLQDMGMIRSGLERYEVINRPLTDDTYLFKPFRPMF